ncbi:unnamed protein product, partial [marine sediment metagenome]
MESASGESDRHRKPSSGKASIFQAFHSTKKIQIVNDRSILDLTQASARIRELKKLIEYHNELYYNQDSPEIPDSLYDKLVQELISLEKKFPSLKDDSPIQRVGGRASDSLKKHAHSILMLSLSNVFIKEELFEFDRRIRRFSGMNSDEKIKYYVEPKLDGLAIELVYKNGKLSVAATRG